MKLLIVDDEDLTRTGVVSSIDWHSLGIDEVLQADDGINGLKMARAHRPEIILCDVRMPRMNGIDMLKQVEEFLPDTVSIFMSGYSDKEYLKAAIRLKSVTYIEKPLDPTEIREAVAEAVRLYHQKQRQKAGEAAHSRQTAFNLALALTSPYNANRERIREFSDELGLCLTADTFFTTVIVRLKHSPEEIAVSHSDIYQNISTFLKQAGLQCLLAEKQLLHMVWFLFGADVPSSAQFGEILRYMHDCYAVCGDFYLSMGDVCHGVSEAYTSYVSAVVRLQSCFFFPSGSVRVPIDSLPESEAEPITSGFPGPSADPQTPPTSAEMATTAAAPACHLSARIMDPQNFSVFISDLPGGNAAVARSTGVNDADVPPFATRSRSDGPFDPSGVSDSSATPGVSSFVPSSGFEGPDPDWESLFSKVLLSENRSDCECFLDELFHYYNGSHTLMPNQVREQYYRLFITLDNTRRQKNFSSVAEKTDTIVDAVENSFTYLDLHEALSMRVAHYLDDAERAAPENTSIARIKDYISKHYMSETLSVRDISEHVFLSVSYVCTLFKNETGQTLNQYLTEYRMEKAKELLEDPRYKISDISAKVGYSDGNYFGKSFRKYTGLSPSEYREKMIR